MSTIAARLRAVAESGDAAHLDGTYVAGARLDAGLPGRRITSRDAQAALAALWDRPAEVVEWDCHEYPVGIALWLERRHGDGTAQRQRHYLHVEAGRITRHWIYGAPPRSTAPVVERPASDVFALVGDVAECVPVVSRGWSGARLERATMTDGRRLIAKRVEPAAEWISRWTADPGREGILARDHVLAGVEGIDAAALTAARDGDAWWIVMRDVSDELLDDSSPLERDDHRRILAALNGMWTAFEGTRIGCLASTPCRLSLVGPPVAGRERDGHDLLPNQFEAAWEAFLAAVDPDVGEAVVALATDPGPLAAALDARGTTLIHGDVRDEQLGFARDGRVVLVDWGLATRGNPAIDLAWYLMHCGWRIRATHDELVDDFRRLRDDAAALELGLVSGLVMYGWILGHSAIVHPDPAEREWARAELEWWVPKARAGLERI
jgi:hypothetical protein